MKVRELFPTPRRPKLPRCEAEVSHAQRTGYAGEWRKRAYAGKLWQKCTRHATWEIGGKKMCALHAGAFVLQQLKENA